jgi:hypothetical protein
MTTKNDNSIKANISGDRNNININVPSSSPDKKETSNWLLKAIVGGVIALIVGVTMYYVNHNIDGKGKDPATVQPTRNLIQSK